MNQEPERADDGLRRAFSDAIAAVDPTLAGRLEHDPDSYLDLIDLTSRSAEEIAQLLRSAVTSARQANVSWERIGQQLGMSRQAAQQRFGRVLDSNDAHPSNEKRRLHPLTAFDEMDALAGRARGRSERYRYTRWMRIRPIDLVDVLVYLVVLGVFIQLLPDVISETFLLALLTAILLKVVLELVLWAKKKIVARIRSAETRRVRVVNAFTLLLVLPGSKFMVLGLVTLAFGDTVRLGGFFQVTALIIVLMLARGGIRRAFRRTDEGASA